MPLLVLFWTDGLVQYLANHVLLQARKWSSDGESALPEQPKESVYPLNRVLNLECSLHMFLYEHYGTRLKSLSDDIVNIDC